MNVRLYEEKELMYHWPIFIPQIDILTTFTNNLTYLRNFQQKITFISIIFFNACIPLLLFTETDMFRMS